MDGRRARQFGHLRSIVHGTPSRAKWLELCRLVMTWDVEVVAPWIPYLNEHLEHWPAAMRTPEYQLKPHLPAFQLVRAVRNCKLFKQMIQCVDHTQLTHFQIGHLWWDHSAWHQWLALDLLQSAISIDLDLWNAPTGLNQWLNQSERQLPHLRTLNLRHMGKQCDDLTPLFSTSWMKHVEVLNLGYRWGALTDSKRLPQSDDYCIREMDMVESTSLELLSQPIFKHVESMRVHGLFGGHSLAHLRAFDRRWKRLVFNHVDASMLKLLGTEPCFESLREARVHCPYYYARELFCVLANLPSLRSLHFSYIALDKTSTETHWAARPESLSLTGCSVYAVFLQHMIQMQWFESLTSLSLINCDGVDISLLIAQLQQRTTPLRSLTLKGMPVTSTQWHQLLALPQLAGLEKLHLTGHEIDATHCHALLKDSVVPSSCDVRLKGRAHTWTGYRRIERMYSTEEWV